MKPSHRSLMSRTTSAQDVSQISWLYPDLVLVMSPFTSGAHMSDIFILRSVFIKKKSRNEISAPTGLS